MSTSRSKSASPIRPEHKTLFTPRSRLVIVPSSAQNMVQTTYLLEVHAQMLSCRLTHKPATITHLHTTSRLPSSPDERTERTHKSKCKNPFPGDTSRIYSTHRHPLFCSKRMWKGPHDHERTFIGRPTICTPFALVFTNRDRFPPVAYPLVTASLRLAPVAYEQHCSPPPSVVRMTHA